MYKDGIFQKIGSIQTQNPKPRDKSSNYLSKQLPNESNRLPLEVIPKRPVPEHLKEGVVIRIFPNVIEIVVLPSRSDALLRVAGALKPAEGRVGVHRPQEDGLVLVHAGIVEEEGGIVEGDDRARRPVDVVLRFEELHEGLTDFARRPLH